MVVPVDVARLTSSRILVLGAKVKPGVAATDVHPDLPVFDFDAFALVGIGAFLHATAPVAHVIISQPLRFGVFASLLSPLVVLKNPLVAFLSGFSRQGDLVLIIPWSWRKTTEPLSADSQH